MIVNSSQGGGSKDTWVLEDDGRRPRRDATPRRGVVAAADARTCAPGELVRPAAAAAAVARCSPGSPTSCTGSAAQLARAEHTARMLDGVFHADLQGRRDDPARRAAVVGRAAGDHGRPSRRSTPADARRGRCALLTLDPERPGLGRCLRHAARARARARVRDVFSAEMWEAINTFHLGLLRRDMSAALRTGPYSRLRLRARALRAVLGRDRAHDAARRGARVPAGGRRDRVRPTWSLRMLRVALPADGAEAEARPARRPGARAAAGGRRLPGLPARGARAAQRAARSRASCSTSATTRTRWRFSVEALHARADRRRPELPRLAAPVLRLGRLMADLDFRARTADGDARRSAATLGDRPARARAGRRRHRRSATSAAPPRRSRGLADR